MKKVIIVKQGCWADMRQGEYERMIGILKRKPVREQIGVELAPTFNDAEDILRQEEVSSAVFISIGMLQEARKLKDEYPELRVVIFTGLIPKPEEYPFSLDGIVLVDKAKIWGRRATLEAILGP